MTAVVRTFSNIVYYAVEGTSSVELTNYPGYCSIERVEGPAVLSRIKPEFVVVAFLCVTILVQGALRSCCMRCLCFNFLSSKNWD